MISRLIFLLFCGHFAQILGNAGKLPRVKKQSLKVQINVTSDAVCMRYIRPTPSTKLEGFVLGYGSNFFSNQYIPLPSNGKMYMTEIDAEPRYLIVVRPVSNKKFCSGKTKTPKPLQLVIGTLTPTSVFLSWGILVNPKHDWTTMNNCPNDRFYTVRYREKDKNKKWILQLCPTTETVVDNLKPNTIYEFGVKDNTDDRIWSKNFIHKVIISGKNKENGDLQNNYKIHRQFIPDSKTFVPVKVIKQVLQNITHRTQSDILHKGNSPLSGPILVHLIVPDFNTTKQKPPSSSGLDIFEKPKQSVAMAEQDLERSKPTAPDVPKDSAVSQAHTKSELESSKPSKVPMTEMPPVTLDLHKFLGLPKTRPSPRPQMPTEPSVSKKMQPVPKTPVPKTIQTKAVPTLPSVKQNIPKTSRITEKLEASPASKEINPVPSKSKEFDYTKPEEPDRKFVSTDNDNYLPNLLTTPEFPITKPVSAKDNYLPKVFITSEPPITKPVSTEDDNYLPKVLSTPDVPITKSDSFKTSRVPSQYKETDDIMPTVPDMKHVSYEPSPVPSKFKEPGSILAEVPDRKPDSYETSPVLPKYKETNYIMPIVPDLKHVSYEPSPVPSKFKEPGSILAEVPDRKPVSTVDNKNLPKVLTTPKLPITKHVPSPVPSKFKEPGYILEEVPDRKHVLEPITFSNELPIVDAETKHHVPITKTTINPLLLPKSEKIHARHKPQTSTEVPQPRHAPKEAHEVPTKPITPSSPDITPNKSSLNTKYHDPSKPKSRPGQKTQQSKPDPKETQLLPSKPKPSDKQGKNKTKPASSKLNNKVTVTKTPRLRKVVHRTTPAPPRTRTPGGSSWSKKPRGEKLTNEDVPKPLHPSSSTNSSVSVDSTVVRKKPDPATLPGSPRPPLAPAKPTPIRRKPLPPNNITGKPGRSGNVLMPRTSTSIAKPTWPSSLVKTNSPKKLPTAAASPDYSNPMFSSIPTTETDITGTPRYTGDHVKYLKKKDDVPCSITDTMQLFPTDMGDNRDMATSAPQKPPTNLTVVTVEGCPSFVVLDWKPPENESITEYKVVSTENGGTVGKDKSIITTNQTHSTVENLKPNTSYEFVVIASNPLGEGPSSESKPFRTESADPRITESISMGKDAIWTEVSFNSDDYSECKGKQYVKRTWYKKFVGVQLCNSLRYKIYLSDSLKGTFYNIGDQRGHGEDHCQFVDSYLDGKTGQMLPSDQLPSKDGYFRAVRQEPVHFGKIGAGTHSTYVHWYECGITIPGKW